MKRLVASLALIVLSACSGSSVEIIAREDLPPDIYGADGERRTDLVVFLVQGNRLIRVSRTGRVPGSDVEAAVRELFGGPTSGERERDIGTRIPIDVELLAVEVTDGVANVDLNGDWLVVEDPDDPHEYILRVAQLVWTLDELPDVRAVRVFIEGQQRAVYDQDRNVIMDPVARKRYQRFEPRSDKPVSEAPIQIDI